MSKDAKELCDWSKKDIREKRERLRQIVTSPQYVCEKCARVAAEKKYLCKPGKL